MRTVLSICLVLVGAARADARPITEEEFLSVLGPEHPAVVALQGDVADAEARQRGNSAWSNPEILLERELWGRPSQQTTAGLGWRPPLGGGRGARVDAARLGVEAALLRREAALLDVRLRARADFAAWWSAVERGAELDRQRDRVAVIVERVRARAERGEASGLSADRFALALLRLESAAVRARVEASRTAARAAAWMGEAWDGSPPARPLLEPPPDTLDWTNRPDLRARGTEVRSAERASDAAGGVLEFPALVLGWVWQDGIDEGDDGALAGLAWRAPLFDRNQGAKTAARGRLAAARAELDLATRRARAELEAARAAYATVRDPALQAWTSTGDLDPLVDAALAAFRAGETRDTDLLDILESVVEARLAALDLYADALAAHRRLERAGAGTPPEGDRP